NGLQALILNDCPYAYYVHCLAHRLQLALVSASREVISVHHFFLNLAFIINIVGASCKRNDGLHAAQVAEIERLISIDELDTGSGVNQIGTLQRAGDTRWSSHFRSISSLLRLYNPTCTVLGKIIEDGSTYSQRGEACVAYDLLTSFEFVFILHLLKEIMEITDILCQALQQKSQDIVNAMHLVAGTKTLIQNLRENGWEKLIETTRKFCNKHDIEIPKMSAQFTMSRALNLARSRRQQAHVTVEHHFQVDVFIATIDSQLQEFNIRFNEHAVELIILSSALNPKDGYRSFDCDKICNLVEKFYPLDFTEQEKILLKCQLQHYQFDVINHPDMQNLCTIAGLCQKLVETGKSEIYYLIDRLLRLVLTLPVSTATTERAFSAMKIIKTRLRSKMEDDFLTNCLVVYIEQAIVEKISVDKIIDDFYDMKKRRAQLRQ
ncbi:Dimer_Tnp_hAT domain-containing protein, partial [Cephalotus follicularis]